jgi:hypothetical protein
MGRVMEMKMGHVMYFNFIKSECIVNLYQGFYFTYMYECKYMEPLSLVCLRMNSNITKLINPYEVQIRKNVRTLTMDKPGSGVHEGFNDSLKRRIIHA